MNRVRIMEMGVSNASALSAIQVRLTTAYRSPPHTHRDHYPNQCEEPMDYLQSAICPEVFANDYMKS